ncbi:protein of unknown function (DUF1987) [Thiovulum sp. ES]|nr:protein of unknown function (DUF1987) [Thiovulum sp. ES]
MEGFFVDKSENSPRILLDWEQGLIEFDGKSYPENTFEFYEPVIEWLEIYFSGKAKNKTVVNIKLIYFNSATTQVLFDIFDLIQDGEKNELEINWFYDGSDEFGTEDYEDYVDEFPDLHIKAVPF